MTDVDTRYPDLDSMTWRSYATGTQFPFSPFALGPVVYTAAEINSWAASGGEYTALLGSAMGSTSRTVFDHSTSFTTANSLTAIDDSIYAKVQAVLWAANGNSAHLAKVVEVLDGFKDITTWAAEDVTRLRLGWVMDNLTQAAAIIGETNYPRATLDTAFRVLYTFCNWHTTGNWFAVFAASRCGIASLLQDEPLWADALTYFDFRIKQSIYHSSYDGASVNPIRTLSWPATMNGEPHAPRTSTHWFGAITAAPWLAEYESTPFADGTDGEVIRDLSHESMTLAGFVQAARTILAVHESLPEHAIDRIRAMADWHGGRCLHYLTEGTLAWPAGLEGSGPGVGGSGRHLGWYPTACLLDLVDGTLPANVTSLLARGEVQAGDGPAGALHFVAERFADRTFQ